MWPRVTFGALTLLSGLGVLEITGAAEIRSVEVGQPVAVTENSGDTWVAAWATNGAVYTPSNDTEGFRKIGWGNLAFNRIDGGDPLRLSGVTVNPMTDYGAATEELADGCTLDFYLAPKPWGPWTKLSSHRFSPEGYYSPQVCPKFTRDGGRNLFVFTAGDWNNPEVYHLTVVPITLRD